MTRWDVCNKALAGFDKPRRFLEIGMGRGRAGREICAEIITGVDPKSHRADTTGYARVVCMTSDEFFMNKLAPLAHVVLIDGLHHADQVLRDVRNCVQVLAPGGLIVLHDCNPPDEASQLVPRPSGQVHWNGDVWKAIVRLRATQPYLKVYTLDTDEGLGLISVTRERQLLIDVPGELTWQGLTTNRQYWLGLIPAQELACH